MNAFCPECGHDLLVDAPVLLNDFAMLGPLWPLSYKGEPVRLTGAEQNLCWALMRSFPDPVKVDTLLERLHSKGGSDMVRVIVHRTRRKLAAMGAPNPIRSIRGTYDRKCYVWVLT